jgi:hypothetical protein
LIQIKTQLAGVHCPASTKLHFINSATGKLLGQADSKQTADGDLKPETQRSSSGGGFPSCFFRCNGRIVS